MYIEFSLPDPNSNDLYTFKSSGGYEFLLKQQIQHWVEKHNVNSFKIKTVKNKLRVTFDNDEVYSFFSVTWNCREYWQKFRIIKDLNNK